MAPRVKPKGTAAGSRRGAGSGPHKSPVGGTVDYAARDAIQNPTTTGGPKRSPGHDFDRLRIYASAIGQDPPSGEVRVSPVPHPTLPANTPAWTAEGVIHLGPPVFFLPPERGAEVLRHEAVHSLHQRLAVRGETAWDREDAERVATRGGKQPHSIGWRDLLRPVPALLAYPPQKYPPWTQVWIGHMGIIGEIVEAGVTVRLAKSYKDLKMVGRFGNDYEAYECGAHDSPPIPDLAARMRKAATKVAEMNTYIPDGAAPQRIALVMVSGSETIVTTASRYVLVGGKGAVELSIADFEGDLDSSLAHEGAHAAYEYHLVGKQPGGRVPDPLALKVADVFVRLKQTPNVPVPTAKFDPKNPPRLTPTEGNTVQPAGLVMVFDTLWSGTGGHPWENADEFFASALAGFIQEPALLRQIIAHYQVAHEGIGAAAKELLELLAIVKNPAELEKLTGPAEPAAAERGIQEITPAQDITADATTLGWLIDPSQMPSPKAIRCPTPMPTPQEIVPKEAPPP